MLLFAEGPWEIGMKSTRKKFCRDNNRFRLMLTLELAVMLPAAALIYVNFHHLKSFKRNNALEGAIHRDFQQMLAISEKRINQKLYAMAEEARDLFPSPDADTESEKERKLDFILSKSPWLAHLFLFDERVTRTGPTRSTSEAKDTLLLERRNENVSATGESSRAEGAVQTRTERLHENVIAKRHFLFRSQPQQMRDEHFREEHDLLARMFRGWFSMQGKMLVAGTHKKNRAIAWHGSEAKRAGGYAYMTTAFFCFPQLSKERVVLGGASFDPNYLQQTFFPELLEELIARKLTEEGGNQLAMAVYPTGYEGAHGAELLAASAGWREGKPEVSRNLEDVFSGLALGIKFQGTSAEALGRAWVQRSFLILGVLSLLLVGGLVLTYRSVSKELALARLKSDFVSNVSHELRTPLALIRLYAETLELGRIKTREKAEEYYRIISKESERLTALINNILDFSRIEAGRKEYDFRETDIGELVRNTLDAYRYQIEQQGFAFEQSIDSSLPVVRVDQEAIARALVNLLDNALKYSADEKFLGVKLYRTNGVLKLEVVDHGIGITRREQSKIFEKFYRTGDPLVHNTRGSGLGLSLVRHVTQAHGGKVEVESTPGKGSKFTLSLPLAGVTQLQTNGAASGATA
jgi:signal transduction histidine kinase